MNIDPNSGLPELPEGLFWSVRYSSTMRWYELQLRKKMAIGSRKLGYWAMWASEFNEKRILEWSKYAMRQPETTDHLKRAQGLDPKRPREHRLLGDYPPKKLNTPIIIQEGQ